jgi:peptide/nickel transport system substrate-binding protein
MRSLVSRPSFAVVALLALVLSACGGDGGKSPTPTPVATSTVAGQSAQTATAGTTSPIASPRATAPVAAPAASGSPQASPVAARTITRDEFKRQLLAKYPMEPAAKKGGTVIVGEAGDISTVNGLLANDSLTFAITGAIFETLVGASPIDGQPVPGLADSWDVSPDGLTYTFHLNQQAKWHDGVDFTADDVKFSFDAILDPNTGSSYRTIVNDAIDSYRVIDPDTFEVTASDRLVSFLYEGPGAVFIMPKHIWENVGTESWSFDGGSTGQDPSRVVGTGPFKFKEWIQGDHVTIVRNDDYWDEVPNIDALTIQVQPNADASVLALQNKQIDVMEIIPPEQVENVRNTEGLKVDIYDFFQFTFYAFNLDPARTPLFQDQQVRQALFYALDRDSITRTIFLGYGEAAVGTQPKLSPAYAPDRMEPKYTFDPEKAKELLANAGWIDSNGNGTVDKDGNELKFDLLYVGGDSVVDQIVSYMQDAWAAVGVKMEPRNVSGNALIDALEAHDFQMALLAFSLTPDGSQGSLFTCDAYQGGFNFMKFCDERYDQLDEQQRREFDPAKRVELLIQQSQIIWEEQPVGVIRFGVARTGYSTRLHNFYPNGYGFLWSLPYVWVE